MTHNIHVNEASREQLKVLLRLSDSEAEMVVNDRPFKTKEQFWDALPRPKAQLRPDMYLNKLDINSVERDQFKRVTGLSDALVNLVMEGRPYFFIFELTSVPTIDAKTFGRIVLFFRTARLQYEDKLSGRVVELTPKPSEAIIRYGVAPQDVETALVGLSVTTNCLHEKGPYALIRTKESESGTRVLRTLKTSSSVEAAFPAFDDESGARRYVDPEFLVVQFKEGISDSVQRQTIDATGMMIDKKHRVAGLYTLRIPDSQINPGQLANKLAEINASDRVKFAEPLFLGFDDLESPTLFSEIEAAADLAWNHRLINLEQAWQLGKGASDIIIAVIDTGVDQNHPALSGSFVEREQDDWDFERDEANEPIDENGHGTFIAGLLVGNGNSGVQGICPDCEVLPLRIPLVSGRLSYVERREAILYALEYVSPEKRLILNISWKTTGDVSLIRDAIATCENHGAVVVASAGNWPLEGGEAHYPSDYDTVLSVGAVQRDKTRATYSYYGGGVDLAAPGGSGTGEPALDILSSLPGGTVGRNFGTSFAAPQVAGVAALLLSREPSLSPADIRTRIYSTCIALPQQDLGNGLINASAVVDSSSTDDNVTENSNGSDVYSPQENDPRRRKVLAAINTWKLETLISRFEIPQITARIILARRPLEWLDAICNIIGMTAELCERIVTADFISNPTEKLVNANSASFDVLVEEVGLPTITARLVLTRRPFTLIDEVGSLLGMTGYLLARLTLLEEQEDVALSR